MFKMECEKTLPAGCRYKGVAYDGCRYYLTIYGENQILQLDSCLNPISSTETCRRYTYICYDPCERCFWAAADKCFSTIYRLNECLEEVACITIRCPGACGGVITGISYDCCKEMLVVSVASGLVFIGARHPENCTFFKKKDCEWMMGVLSLCPFTICYIIGKDGQFVRIYSDRGRLLGETEIPKACTVESAVFVPDKCDRRNCRFLVLTSKQGGYSHMLSCVLKCDPICEKICECNYKICCENKHCERPHDRCCEDSCCEVLSSIALVEASIAHVLNAEGEKLQKAIASTDNVCELLKVNESVGRTIEKATHLECVLYDKMGVLKKWSGECRKNPPCMNDCDCDEKCLPCRDKDCCK